MHKELRLNFFIKTQKMTRFQIACKHQNRAKQKIDQIKCSFPRLGVHLERRWRKSTYLYTLFIEKTNTPSYLTNWIASRADGKMSDKAPIDQSILLREYNWRHSHWRLANWKCTSWGFPACPGAGRWGRRRTAAPIRISEIFRLESS